MLGASPFRLIILNVSLRTLAECLCIGIRCYRGGSVRAFVGDRVNVIEAKLPGLGGALSGLCERQGMLGADPHISGAGLALGAALGFVPSKNPLLAAALRNPEIKAAAIGVHAGLLCSRHFQG